LIHHSHMDPDDLAKMETSGSVSGSAEGQKLRQLIFWSQADKHFDTLAKLASEAVRLLEETEQELSILKASVAEDRTTSTHAILRRRFDRTPSWSNLSIMTTDTMDDMRGIGMGMGISDDPNHDEDHDHDHDQDHDHEGLLGEEELISPVSGNSGNSNSIGKSPESPGGEGSPPTPTRTTYGRMMDDPSWLRQQGVGKSVGDQNQNGEDDVDDQDIDTNNGRNDSFSSIPYTRTLTFAAEPDKQSAR